MELVDVIKIRRSVREYNGIPLNGDVVSDIYNYLQNIKIDFSHTVRFELSHDTSVYKSKATDFIICYGESTPKNYFAIGEILAILDLYIQSLGLGSLFLGMGKSKADDYLFTLVFGNSDVPFRSSLNEFKRIPISEFANTTNEYTSLVRLVPTAMNSMPFQIVCKQNKINISLFKRGFFAKALLKTKVSYLDIGILISYTQLYYNSKGYTLDINILSEACDSIEITLNKEK